MSGRRVKVTRNDRGDWWWHVLAANGQDILSDSGQGYSRRIDALAVAVDLHPDLPIDVDDDGDAAHDDTP